ncbi:MAG: DUF885 domain-containing protein [Euryarchaeota archaeon]|nr:DUF885 domain-containing protein [Euryarchaeota archaeon]
MVGATLDPERGIPSLEVPPGATSEERSFAAVEREVVEHLFRLSPGLAVVLGIHSYDGLLPDLGRSSVENWARRSQELLAKLGAFGDKELSRDRKLDRDLLRLRLRSELFDLVDYLYLDRLPLAYVGPLELVPYTARPYAPAAHRAEAMVRVLRGAPSLLRTGLERLSRPLPEAFVKIALAMAEGLVPHFRESESFVRNEAPSLLREYQAAREGAEAAATGFVEHLRGSLPGATGDFALGPERFQRLLKVREGLELPWAALEKEGWEDLRRNQRRLEEIARSARPPTTKEAVLKAMAADHPRAEDLLSEAAGQVEETRRFVLDKELVTIPTPERCRVEPTPLVDRAWTTASMDPPGPFETSTHEGVYHVTPVEDSWDAEKKEQWLASFNRPVLRNVTAHEVYPGHYVQFLHFRAHTSTLTRRVYLSGAFTEGWAHYTEQLMIEQGFRAGEPAAELAELTDALLRDVRLLASVGMHARGTTVAQATTLFEKEAHMEHFPAEREAMRGTFNPEYFGYTLGKLAILKARRAYFERHPGSSLKSFHDLLLSFGAPPVGFLEPLLLGTELPSP